VNRHADAAFSALIGLDPIAGVQRTERLDPLNAADNAHEDLCVARIVAVPRPNRSKIRHAPREGQGSGGSHRGRSPCGVLGLAISAAVAVAATLLWVSPSAGAPSRQAVTIPAHAERVPARGVGTTAPR
jgi:hypothetical protein